MNAKSKLDINAASWNKVANLYSGYDCLPYWGPFGVGADLKLITKIKGLSFLEIGCGSGHSIQYLASKGAKKVYGIDISKAQIDLAVNLNQRSIHKKTIQLMLAPMERRQNIKNIDVVYSIYAISWSVDHKKTLTNIFQYLKPGGRFIFSLDHKVFRCVTEEKKKIYFNKSYHAEPEEFIKNWKDTEGIYLRYLKIETWFRLLREVGFTIDGYFEPAPQSKDLSPSSSTYTYKKSEFVPTTVIFNCRKV